MTPIRYFGGQHYNAPWLVSNFPPRKDYATFIDACVGGGSVTLEHDPVDKNEIINDCSPDLINFWNTLADPVRFDSFERMIQAVPSSQLRWQQAVDAMAVKETIPLERWGAYVQLKRALDYFIVARQSMSGRHARRPVFAPTSTSRLRRGMNEQASCWINAIAKLPQVHERLMRVQTLNLTLAKLLAKYLERGTFTYIDPPWSLDTRARGEEVYEFEMTTAQHEEYLKLVTGQSRALVMISGRNNEMYDDYLRGWDTRTRMHPMACGGANEQKLIPHVIWSNYDLPAEDQTH